MRTRTALSTLTALFTTAGLATCATGCGSSQATLDPIAQAANLTTHSGGSQIATRITVDTPQLPAPLTIAGTGEFNMSRQEGELFFDLSGLPASVRAKLPNGELQITELFKDGDLYMRSALLDGRLPGGARWIKLDLAKLESDIGVNVAQLSSGESNPTQFVQYLRASGGKVKAIGQEALRGTATTRYEGQIDLVKEAEQVPANNRAQLEATIKQLIAKTGSSSVPVSVWIDQHHLLRRLKMGIPLAAANGTRGSVEVDYELFGFGATPTINPPAVSETFDATTLSAQGLSSGG